MKCCPSRADEEQERWMIVDGKGMPVFGVHSLRFDRLTPVTQ